MSVDLLWHIWGKGDVWFREQGSNPQLFWHFKVYVFALNLVQ